KLFLVAVISQSVLLQAAFSQGAGGQETREGSLAAEQAEKSTKLHPPVPDRAEALVSKLEGIFLDNPSGFYPFFGSVYHGGGLTLGAGLSQVLWRQHLLGHSRALLGQKLQAD